MNLNTITSVRRPALPGEVGSWQPGFAWLAGGTWLFSEPQPSVDTLIDLESLGWLPLEVNAGGLEIAATARIIELYRLSAPADWHAAPLIKLCCECFLASFKIWNAASVGGNICMSLPAGPMISLTAALEGVATLWPVGGMPRQVPIADFVTGNHANVLAPGELLRSIHLPTSALRKRFAMRRISLTKLGRSAALVIGTQGGAGEFLLTITAATPRPVQVRFAALPTSGELATAVDAAVSSCGWFDDVHGSADYKQHVSRYFAEEIRQELALGDTE